MSYLLFQRFLFKYSPKFEKNPRMAMQINLLKKMPKEKLENHLKIADDFIKNLFIANWYIFRRKVLFLLKYKYENRYIWKNGNPS